MSARLTPHFGRRSTAGLGLVLLAVAGCASSPAPEGGVAPSFASIPPRAAPLLSPPERAAMLANLDVDRDDAAQSRGVVEARIGRIERAPEPVPLPAAPMTGGPLGRPGAPPAPPLIGTKLVAAQGLLALADAARTDRVLLQQRLDLTVLPPPPGPVSWLVTALVMVPDSAELPALERQRLARSVVATGVAGDWSVTVSGDDDLAGARGDAIAALLVEGGVVPDRITVDRGEREVDLAEVRVRR